MIGSNLRTRRYPPTKVERKILIPRIFKIFNNYDTTSYPTYESRKKLFEELYQTVTGSTPTNGENLVIYVDDSVSESVKEILTTIDIIKGITEDEKDYWETTLLNGYETYSTSMNYEGLNLTYADGVANYKSIVLVYVATDSNQERYRYHTELWTLIHEIYHNIYPKSTGSPEIEQQIQVDTYKYLKSLWFIDDIGIVFINMLSDYAYDIRDKDTESYNIFEYIVQDLRQDDPSLLYTYLEIATMLGSTEMSELANKIMDTIDIEINPYEGVWY